jgi:riboflavin kinase/FMN adenylyltransferase
MKVYRDFENVEFDKETVLTMGTFDGVHRGHKTILNRLNNIAQKNKLRSVVMTLDPHPQIVLQKSSKKPISLLTNVNERISEFRNAEIDACVVMTFSYEFSQIPAEEFIRDYLVKKVGLKKILIGYDHMFGKDRDGDQSLLERLGEELNFTVERLEPMQDDDIIISSTKIRNALIDSNVEVANEMLGYDYKLQGTVVHGDNRGKDLGFPTANILPPNMSKLVPGNGVYIVSAKIDGEKYYGMTNVGTRPTFHDADARNIEVHFLNLNKDLYEKEITIQFLKYIREEKKFNGAEELVAQINKDKETAINYVNSLK